MKLNKYLITLGILIVISLLLTIKLTMIESLRVVFGSFYVLFLPGYLLTYVFFKKDLHEKEGIDFIERLTLSFALSIAIVPLVVFYLNKLGIKINTLNSFLIILGIIIITFIILKKNNSLSQLYSS